MIVSDGMKNVVINESEYEIELFVFDKDGLMFESGQFWVELAQSRIRAMYRNYPDVSHEVVRRWMQLVGGSCKFEDGYLKVTDMDPMGIFAVAPVPEEILVAASFFAEHLGLDWLSARKMAEEVFTASDELFELERALKPRRGFPQIFHRLREAKIPYGIATSDTKERAKLSVDLFDDYGYVDFTVTVDDVEKGKPNPDMLLLIQKQTGISMEKIAMVGDSLVDVKMAREAGAIGIGIPEQESMRQNMQGIADEIIESLDDICIKKGE